MSEKSANQLGAAAVGLGIGLAAVARPAYITAGRAGDLPGDRTVDALRARTFEVLDAAYAGGIRYVDVARSYGYAERFLRDWMDTHPEIADITVGSKWGYRYVGDWRMDAAVHEIKDHSRDAFTRQLAETRAILETRLGIYHIHSATPETGVLADRDLMSALARLRDTGVAIGLSVSGPSQADSIREAMRIRVDGTPLFTSVQATWNPLEPSAGAALEEAAHHGARVIVKEALANGRLVPGQQGDDPGAARMAHIADEVGMRIDCLALAAALSRPWVWRVLSGAVDAGQVRENLSAVGVSVSAGAMSALGEVAEEPNRYWSGRSARSWN